MSQPGQVASVKEYIVRVPKNSRKKYHMMRFHTANGIEFRNWSAARMERENNYKEFKSAQEDQPKFGAGSEFGREQRDEARRKRYGINIKKYKPDNQPWLLTVKDKQAAPPAGGGAGQNGAAGSSGTQDKKFKGIREGGVSDNVSWYVFLQAKDGAFEAYPVEEWYNFQAVNRYNALSAEEAEIEFERRDKIMNYFSVMYQKKLRNEEEEVDAEDVGKKKGVAKKQLQLSEMDDWMSDKESDDDGDEGSENGEERKPKKKDPRPKKGKRKQGGKSRKKEDGDSGTDCGEESDEYDEGAEHEYESADSSDPEHNDDEKVTKDLTGVEEGKALKKLLNSDDEDEDEEDEEEEKKKKEEEEQQRSEEEKKKKKSDSSPDASDSSDDEKPKAKDSKKVAPAERQADVLKRKLADNPDGLMPAVKKSRSDSPTQPALLPSDSGMFEDQIRRYLVRKPMTTTEILQKLKNKKTGHSSEQLVGIIAVMLKKINPQRQRIKGKMYLSLKSING